MICPHCEKGLTFRQRGGRRCGECKQEFAFEPKGHPLALHDRRFRKVVDRLARDGSRYTAEQLRYALSRKPVAAQRRTPPGATMAGFVFAAVFAAIPTSVILGPTVGLVVAISIVAGGAIYVVTRPKGPFHPKLPMTAAKFRTDVLDRWEAVYGEPPDGLVDPESLRQMPPEERPTESIAAVVACPERDVLACLLANHAPRTLGVGLIPVRPPFDEWETALVDRLRKNRRLPLFVLHDASVSGVLLARDLPLRLGLDPKHRVYDLGMHPKRSIEKRRLTLGEPLSEPLGARLAAELSTAEPASVRPIRRGRAATTDEEVAWLRDGYFSPVLALGPANLLKRIRFAIAKLDAKRRVSRREAVGFMTWPEA